MQKAVWMIYVEVLWAPFTPDFCVHNVKGEKKTCGREMGKQWLAYARAGIHSFLMSEWESPRPPCLPSTGEGAKKRSSCFKHLQMVMHQQLVSIQLGYCTSIKKTGQSLKWTAKLPCRVEEHFTRAGRLGERGKVGLLLFHFKDLQHQSPTGQIHTECFPETK